MNPSSSTPGCFSGIFSRLHRRVQREQPPPSESNDNIAPSSSKIPFLNTNAALQRPVEFSSPCCDFSYRCELQGTDAPPSYSVALEAQDGTASTDVSVVHTIEHTLDSVNLKLRMLSLDIHAHPEIMFEEKYAHDLLTDFLIGQGFQVTKHYLGLSTAWRAEFSFGKGGRVVGINSEMDALPGIGHACGHNLIAVAGVGIALALKAALLEHRIPGKVVLLGTPAEEAKGGKVKLLDRGGYQDMDICLMCHPAPGDPLSASIGPTIAMQPIEVEFFGHSAHAGAAPWEGTNALDAAFLAYSSVSMLRQQMKPDHRVHGVINGHDWSPNVIPDYAKMRWLVRAPTVGEMTALVQRVQDCFRAAALATACSVEVSLDVPYYDLRQNQVLAQHFADVVGSRYCMRTISAGSTASTDFGNISYVLPVIHPAFAIPTVPHGGNHTPAFAKAAASQAAHEAMMLTSKGLALTGMRAITDPGFFAAIQAEHKARHK
ncbi:aminoacylase 1-like protein 2 [Coprinopsis marcescibilis]|uniref:Aminoacylase 1-like protein 2 n=1 Tax=Coprinopsis marcescibilis TaxID=230819 RepID=A0A5C3LB92_COPMA|nr:aminoacylase 1-like protein 2 [Coprinopsis marcescibilis]